MVLRNHLADPRWQPIPLRELDAIGDVSRDHLCRGDRIERVVDVGDGVRLVLDEGPRPLEFADVVVVGGDANQQRIGADHLSRALGEIADHDAVVIRAGRFHQQAAQQRLGGIGQLEQLHGGENPEQATEQRKAANR